LLLLFKALLHGQKDCFFFQRAFKCIGNQKPLGWHGTFISRVLWSVRDGKGLISVQMLVNFFLWNHSCLIDMGEATYKLCSLTSMLSVWHFVAVVNLHISYTGNIYGNSCNITTVMPVAGNNTAVLNKTHQIHLPVLVWPLA
jgi:hypothetical protein